MKDCFRETKCKASYRGDGLCNWECNNPYCNYDDGDCCPETNKHACPDYQSGKGMASSTTCPRYGWNKPIPGAKPMGLIRQKLGKCVNVKRTEPVRLAQSPW